MLKIFIQGLKDGIYDIEQAVEANLISDLYDEFKGEIFLKGKLRKLGNKYTFSGTVECDAELICDLTLVEYTERIKANINACFIADNSLHKLKSKEDSIELSEYIINEDEKYIDLTNEVREELVVNLPMKRIAPQFRDKTFEELYPELFANANIDKSPKKKKKLTEIDERWDALKKLKLN